MDLAGFNASSGPITVELDLVQPPITGRRLVDEHGKLRRYELRE